MKDDGVAEPKKIMNRFHHQLLNKIRMQKLIHCVIGYVFYIKFSVEKWLKGKPIIVYQMGKVGSKTVVESLQKADLGCPIYHVHRISSEGLRFVKEKSLAIGRAYPGKPYWAGKYLADQLNLDDSRAWDIIILVRDPVARNLSAFFHAQDYWYPQLRKITKEGNYSEPILREIKQVFLEKFDHNIPLQWFDNEINSVFDLNVYATPFPKDRGYYILRNQKARFLLLKLELLDGVYQQAFKDFLIDKNPNFELTQKNIAKDKSYNQIYHKFLDWLSLPEEYLNSMYESRYATHFYSPEEIAILREKWSILSN